MDAKYVIKSGRDYWDGEAWDGSQRKAKRYDFGDILFRKCAAFGGRPVRLALKTPRKQLIDPVYGSAIIAALDNERAAIAASLDADAADSRVRLKEDAARGFYADAVARQGDANVTESWATWIRERKGKPAGAK